MRSMRVLLKVILSLLGVLIAAVVVLILGLAVFHDHVRQYVEHEINDRIEDYQVRIGALGLRFLRPSIDARDVAVMLIQHPDPPVLQISRVSAKLSWSGLLRGAVVATVSIDQPVIRLTRGQAGPVAHDVKRKTPNVVEQQTWQDRVLSLTPMTVTLALREGDVSYIEDRGEVPLHISHLNVYAGPIRNIRSARDEYPTDLHIKGGINDDAQVEVRGHADLFAVPYPSAKADLSLQNLELGRLLPLGSRYHVQLYQGRLSTDGSIEYAPWTKRFNLRQLRLERAFINYIYEPSAPKPEKHAAKKTADKAADVARQPETLVQIERVNVIDSEFGIVHAGADPPYRVFFNHVSAEMTNFSNRLKEKMAEMRMKGAFMGSGDLEARGMFRPETKTPDFDMSVRLHDVQAKMLNDVLHAHGNVDVAGGELSVYSQLRVQDGHIQGYVKPLIRHLNIYDPDQERGKGLFHKLYEGTLDAATAILENSRREEVGTKVNVKGEVGETQVDTWQAAWRLVENAFTQVVLPTFERPARPGGGTVVLAID